MSYPTISLATATVGRHRCPQKRLQTARQPPVYSNSSPDHRPCNSLTPLPLSSRRLSVSIGGFGLSGPIADQAQGRQILVSSLFKELTDTAGDIWIGQRQEVELNLDPSSCSADGAQSQIKGLGYFGKIAVQPLFKGNVSYRA